jgi:hypothetical protein
MIVIHALPSASAFICVKAWRRRGRRVRAGREGVKSHMRNKAVRKDRCQHLVGFSNAAFVLSAEQQTGQ